jgi:hypothetical protein
MSASGEARLYILFAILLVGAGLVWLGRKASGGRTRLATTAFSILALGGAVVASARGAWILGVGLLALSLWLGVRARAIATGQPTPRLMPMSERRARSLLGVSAQADAQEIQAAYLRLIRTVHPDRGGTEGLAAELNAARDRLLRG